MEEWLAQSATVNFCVYLYVCVCACLCACAIHICVYTCLLCVDLSMRMYVNLCGNDNIEW